MRNALQKKIEQRSRMGGVASLDLTEECQLSKDLKVSACRILRIWKIM